MKTQNPKISSHFEFITFFTTKYFDAFLRQNFLDPFLMRNTVKAASLS